jgi:hypothetical protein
MSPPIEVTVNVAHPPAWGVMPSAITLRTGQSTLLEAMDSSGAIREKVRWAILEGTAGGLVTDAGQYVSPTTAGVYHLVCTDPDDPSQTATATITVVAGGGGGGSGNSTPTNQGVMVAPDVVSIPSGTYQGFSAMVTGLDDQTVTWTVENGPSTATVDASGVFVANQPGTYRVFATSGANPVLNGSAVISVVSSVQPIPNTPVLGPLRGYSVTALRDGRVLIVGGTDGVNFQPAAYLFDPQTKSLTQVGTLLQARSWHTATLLDDGRVLIAGGIDPSQVSVAWAEVFDPTTNVFQALPTPPQFPSAHAGQMRAGHGARGPVNDAARLGNGQVLVVGGEDDTYPYGYNLSDVFDPTTNLFDLSNCLEWPPIVYQQVPNAIETFNGARLARLTDGRLLMAGGASFLNDPLESMIKAEARIFDGSSQSFTLVASMAKTRIYHTLTPLPDGRVLAAGGFERYTSTEGTSFDYGVSSRTAEVFDPQTGIWSPAGDMSEARACHAALLLPTGKVLIFGGKTENGDGSYSWPKTSELFDPGTNTFSVMDHLDYGLSEPKLALLQDGSVFVAGQVQAPMETPEAIAQAKMSKIAAADSLNNLTLLIGSTLFGQIAAAPRSDAYPEESALRLNDTRTALIPILTNADAQGIRTPSLARISVPLPSSINPPQAQPDLQIGVNQLARYFMLKIQKPTADAEIIGIRANLAAGTQNQVVTGTDNGFQGLAAGIFERVQTRGDVTYQNAVGTDERTTEDLRKNWLQNWLPAQIPGPQDPARLTEYYRVRVTLAAGNLANVRYGVIDGNNVAPPSDTLAYTFRVQYRVAGQVRECDVTSHGNVRAHWSTAQFFQNSRYGTWNSDKWVLRSVWNWMSTQANRDLLEPVNDITLEHGRNLGHGKEHLRGDGIDTFHPGYTSYRDSQGNAFILDMNADEGEGGRFRDALIGDLQIARSGDLLAPATIAARNRLVTWVQAARNRILAIVNAAPPNGHARSRILYLVNAQNRAGTQLANQTSFYQRSLLNARLIEDCIQLRNLLFKGTCDSYTISGQAQTSGVDLGIGIDNNLNPMDQSQNPERFGWDISDTHSHHLHLTFRSPTN